MGTAILQFPGAATCVQFLTLSGFLFSAFMRKVVRKLFFVIRDLFAGFLDQTEFKMVKVFVAETESRDVFFASMSIATDATANRFFFRHSDSPVRHSERNDDDVRAGG